MFSGEEVGGDDENGDVKNDIIQSITDSAKKLDSDQGIFLVSPRMICYFNL